LKFEVVPRSSGPLEGTANKKIKHREKNFQAGLGVRTPAAARRLALKAGRIRALRSRSRVRWGDGRHQLQDADRCGPERGKLARTLLLTTAACGGSGGDTPAPAASKSVRSGSNPSAGDAAPVPVESNSPGDIPDNLAFVPNVSRAGHYSFTHPGGWARVGAGQTVTFTES
jgi:hypothetical protein